VGLQKEKTIASALKYIQKGQLEKALKEYLSIIENEPNDVRIILRAAEIHARIGDIKNAIDMYMKAASIYTNQGFYLKAIAVYKNVLKIDELKFQAHDKLAELYSRLGLTNEAKAQYLHLCDLLRQQSIEGDLSGTLNKIIELDPGDISMRIKLADYYSSIGRTADAASELLSLANTLRDLGMINEHAGVLDRYFLLRPDDIETGIESARYYLDIGEPYKAARILQICNKKSPDDPRVSAFFEETGLKNLKPGVSGLSDESGVTGENTCDDKSFADSGLRLIHGGDEKEIESLQRTIAMDPANPAVRRELISILEKSGRLEEYKNESLSLARLLLNNGRNEEARQMLTGLQEKFPEEAEASAMLEKLETEMAASVPDIVTPEKPSMRDEKKGSGDDFEINVED